MRGLGGMPREKVVARAEFKRGCKRRKDCTGACRLYSACKRLPLGLRQADELEGLEDLVELELEPTGGTIRVRQRPDGTLDFTELGHLTPEQLEQWRAWDAYHEAWELTYDRRARSASTAAGITEHDRRPRPPRRSRSHRWAPGWTGGAA